MAAVIGARRRARLRIRLREIHGDFCCWCQQRMIFEPAFRRHDLYATIEHIVERRQGGGNDMDNLKLSHRKCNIARSSQSPDPNSNRSKRKDWRGQEYNDRYQRWAKGKSPTGTRSPVGVSQDEVG